MELILLDKIILTLINTTAIGLGLWVYFAGEGGSKTRKYFSFVTLSMLIWINAGYFLTYSTHLDSAMIWARLAPSSVLIFLILFYLFSLFFPKKQNRNPILNGFLIFWSLILSLITLITSWVIETVNFEKWGVNPIFSEWGQIVFYATVTIFTSLIVSNLIKNYLTAPARTKTKVQYLFAGFFVFILMNLIFNIFLPLFRNSIQYWQFGNYSAIFLLGFTSYAIVKKELFNIKVALTSVVVVLIAILLAIDFFILTETSGVMVLKGATFVAFLALSVVLFRVMNNEARQKEEIERVASELEKANRDLKKLDHAKSEFLSIASHQLRTPLTAMRGYLSMLIKEEFGPLSPRIKEVSNEVYQASLRLLRLSNDLLSVSRIQTGKLALTYKKVSVKELISSVVKEFKIEAGKKGLALKIDIENDLPPVEIDAEKIRQVILNIVDNALKYTKEGGATVSAKLSQPDRILIQIEDTGAGLDKKDMNKLFQSFSRGQAGASFHSAGTGLGLYVARKFVDQHKGRIWVRSPGRGQGSTFFVELPVKALKTS